MSKSRSKIKLPEIATREQAEAMMNSYAADANSLRALSAQMDEEILAVKESYEAGIGALDVMLEEKKLALLLWAQAHPEEFPKGRKSIEFLSGVLGFRTGTPKLKLLAKWTWKKVLDLMHSDFVRVVKEVDREKLLAQRETLASEFFERHGIKVVQDETFFIEPKLTDNDARKTVKEAA